jgi:DNA-binding NarL/FixJ family response regulator
MSVTILLVDDHPVVRQGLRVLLERERFEILGEASDGLEAIAMAQRLQPDVVVLDLAMPGLNGLGAARDIVKVSSRSKIVMLTMYTEEHHILEALRAGVKACVSKTQAAEQLIGAIREVCSGGMYLSPSVSGAVVQAYLAKTDPPADPVILSVSVKTAETHRTKLMEKLDIHSTAGLVRYAIRRGLVQP